MGASTFNADVGLVAVCFCVSVLFTSCTLDGVCFIEVRRFCLYNSVLKPCYFVIFLFFLFVFGAGSSSTKNRFSGSLVDL
jgi:hypothetical protein